MDPTENFQTYFSVIGNTIDIIIMVASIIFFWSFSRIHEKTHGLYLILILVILDCLFPISNLVSIPVVRNLTTARAFVGAESGLFHFGLYWTTGIAVFLFLVLKYKKHFSPRTFIIRTIFICFLVSLSYPFMIWNQFFGIEVVFYGPGSFGMKPPTNNLEHQLAYLIIFDLIGKLVPIIITFCCYVHVYRLVASPYNHSAETHTQAPRVLWYSAIQICCFLPGILTNFFTLWGFSRPVWLSLIVFTLHHSWAFLNLIVYWFLRPSANRKIPLESEESESSFMRSDNELSLTMISNF